jgi:hypothetical protein
LFATVGNAALTYRAPNVENPSDELKLFDPISLNETSATSEACQMQRPSVYLHSSSAKSPFLLDLF